MKTPKYIQQIIDDRRLQLAPGWEHDEYCVGYYFRLYRNTNGQYLHNLEREAAKIAAWAEREYAESKVVKTVTFSTKEHRKPYYKRDYVLLLITDPVALKIEKDNRRSGKICS